MIAVESFIGIFYLTSSGAAVRCACCLKWWLQLKPCRDTCGVAVRLVDMVKILVIAFALYSLWWYFHFAYLPYTGEYHGDLFMPMAFQQTLIGGPHYKVGSVVPRSPCRDAALSATAACGRVSCAVQPNAPGMGFWELVWYINAEMLRASSSIAEPHEWESKHYQWILNIRGVDCVVLAQVLSRLSLWCCVARTQASSTGALTTPRTTPASRSTSSATQSS
jgi:dolichyl-phosphate-mannose--protein O-mannosyl transferase